jgi:predicted HicB family RNase H-like nuclease
MAEKKLTKQIVVRVEDDLYEQLEIDADTYGRTVAQTVRHRLKEALYAAT